MELADQAVSAPKSSAHIQVEQLGYVESFDAVVDKDYAFVVYRETTTATGKWVVRIKGSVTAGTALDPDNPSLKKAFKKAAGHDEPHAVWGFNLQPKDGDPRLVENRILVNDDGQPTAIEIHLITRKADSSARTAKTLKVDWPA